MFTTIPDAELAEMSAAAYKRVLGHVFEGPGSREVEMVHDAARGDRGFATRTRASADQPWRLRGNGTMGGIWLTMASAAAQFLNQTLPSDRRCAVVMDS